jgi:hypothetical protein
MTDHIQKSAQVTSRGRDSSQNFKFTGGLRTGVEKVSDHRTIGLRKFFEFPENISPRMKKKIIVKI